MSQGGRMFMYMTAAKSNELTEGRRQVRERLDRLTDEQYVTLVDSFSRAINDPLGPLVEQDMPGVTIMPMRHTAPAVSDLLRLVSSHDMLSIPTYSLWMARRPIDQLTVNDDVDAIYYLATAVRAERFSWGALDAAMCSQQIRQSRDALRAARPTLTYTV